jgi:cobyrinic acid a,c-diamide synthase
VAQITGLPCRHLDAWLMPPEVCRDVFSRGARQADLAIVEGSLDNVGRGLGPFPYDRPGPLGPIVEALDLPVIALVECRRAEGFHLPKLRPDIDGILLDGVECPEDVDTVARLIRHVLKKPVIGAVDAMPDVRAAIDSCRNEGPLPAGIIDRLEHSFLRYADLCTLRAIAESRPSIEPCDAPSLGGGRGFRVAYAQDAAFGEYFPDTLETLEALGAELVEFSPLSDETLPRGVDLVMIGCGFPDRYAEALAANVSLISALQQHVCRGHRIYSEGGGTAYLGRTMILQGHAVRGAGILPFDAVLRSQCKAPSPVTRVLSRGGWVGPAGTIVRGYRSGRWTLRPCADFDDRCGLSGALTQQRDIFYRHHAVGGLIHLHLAALPEVVSAFAGPHRPSLTLPRAQQRW